MWDELRILGRTRAESVARHLVAVAELLDDEPDEALRQARAARSLAPRLAIVRETVGLAAYRAGDYSTAMAELRAYQRMSGDDQHLPLLADAERGLGRPERALDLARQVDPSRLDPAAQVELLLVMSGALRDLGRTAEALAVLQVAELDSPVVKPWTARLWYGYAEGLLAVGRCDEAQDWFAAVATISDETDAEERVATLEGEDDGSII